MRKFESGTPMPNHKRKNLTKVKQASNLKISQIPSHLPKGVYTAMAYYCDDCRGPQFGFRSDHYYKCLEAGHKISTTRPQAKTAGRSLN